MKQPFALLAVVLLAIGLAGCASQSQKATASPKVSLPKVATNEAACIDFGSITKTLAKRIAKGSNSSNAGEFKTTMDTFPALFDNASLKGHGTVADRLSTLVSNLPNNMVMLYIDSAQYSKDVASIGRACDREGFHVNAYTWG